MRFFYFFIFFTLNVYSQNLIVVDSITKSPIENISLNVNNQKFYTTNSKGFVDEYKKNNNDTLEFTHVSYKSKKVNVSLIKDSIFLFPNTIVLGEVVISNIKKNEINSKLLKRKKSYKNFIIFNKSEILAQIIPSSKLLDFKLKELHFVFDKTIKEDKIDENELIAVQISIYNNDNKNELSKNEKIFTITKKINPMQVQNLIIDLKNEQLNINENGFVIGLKNLGYISKTGIISDKKCLFRIAMTGYNSALYKVNTYFKWSDNTITSSKDFLEKMYQADIKIQKNKQDNLNFGIVLTTQ